jgi:CCR4-NOT transcription complex subunit 1
VPPQPTPSPTPINSNNSAAAAAVATTAATVAPAASTASAPTTDTPTTVQLPSGPLLTAEDKAILRSSLPIDTLLAGSPSIPTPDGAVQDRVHFIFNNVSQQNMTQKLKELLDAVPRQYFPWLAQYIVIKRASIEPNFHHIYLQFLERLDAPQLTRQILLASYRNIKTLLQSDKIATSQSERTLLKNLGSWVGNLTLAKNKPILHKHLDLKVERDLCAYVLEKSQQQLTNQLTISISCVCVCVCVCVAHVL